MRLEQLDAFVEIHRRGSVSQAAEALFVTQPTLTARLKGLERELEYWVLSCTKCGLDVHWVSGVGTSLGHWAHREPAPHGEPGV